MRTSTKIVIGVISVGAAALAWVTVYPPPALKVALQELDAKSHSLTGSDEKQLAERNRTSAPAPQAKALDPAPAVKSITLAKFHSLKIGMSYQDAAEILESDGKLISSPDLAETHREMYSWANDDGSNITTVFVNGRLDSKAQFNLK